MQLLLGGERHGAPGRGGLQAQAPTPASMGEESIAVPGAQAPRAPPPPHGPLEPRATRAFLHPLQPALPTPLKQFPLPKHMNTTLPDPGRNVAKKRDVPTKRKALR